MSFSNHINICHTHKQSLEHYHRSVFTIILKSDLSVALGVSCCKEVTQREIHCSCIHMLYVMVLSKYAKCVIIVKVYHNSLPIPHNHFLENIPRPNNLASLGPN